MTEALLITWVVALVVAFVATTIAAARNNPDM